MTGNERLEQPVSSFHKIRASDDFGAVFASRFLDELGEIPVLTREVGRKVLARELPARRQQRALDDASADLDVSNARDLTFRIARADHGFVGHFLGSEG